MKILLLAPQPFFQVRGTPIAERALAESLSQAGHRVDILTYHEGQDPRLDGCTIYRIPRLPGIRNIRPGLSFKKVVCDLVLAGKCAGLVRKGGYDILHAVEESAFIALAMKGLFGIPYVYDMDSALTSQIVEQRPWLRLLQPVMERLEQIVMRQSLCVLAVCKLLEDRVKELAPSTPTVRIEDVSLLTPTPGGPSVDTLLDAIHGPIVMYIGNLEKYQGMDLLLQGFALAWSQLLESHLVVIGGEPGHIETYERMAEQLGVSANVHFLGPQPPSALAGFLAGAQVVVSPRTAGINTPLKVFSYLDSGVPLLATRLPTHTQVLDDDVALLVDPVPQALGDGFVELLSNPTLRSQLVVEAKRRVQEEFSREAFDRKVIGFCEQVEAELLQVSENLSHT